MENLNVRGLSRAFLDGAALGKGPPSPATRALMRARLEALSAV